MPSLPRSAGQAASLAGRWGEINHGEDPSGLEGGGDGGIHRRRIGKVVVHAAHEHRVAAAIREVRPPLVARNDRDLLEAAPSNLLAERSHPVVAELARIDAARGSDDPRHCQRQLAITGAHLADRAPIARADRFEDLPIAKRRPLRRNRSRDQQRDEQCRVGGVRCQPRSHSCLDDRGRLEVLPRKTRFNAATENTCFHGVWPACEPWRVFGIVAPIVLFSKPPHASDG